MHKKACEIHSTSFLIRKYKLKSYDCTPIRMAKIFKIGITSNSSEDAEKLDHTSIAGENGVQPF